MSKTLDKVIAQLQEREELGESKYGTTVDREDLTMIEWLEHAKQEAMDQVLYLQRCIDYLQPNNQYALRGFFFVSINSVMFIY